MTHKVMLDPSLFRDDAISEETRAVNAAVLAAFEAAPQWWEIGAPAYRKGRSEGAFGFPAVAHLKLARTHARNRRAARRVSAYAWRRLGAGRRR